MLRRWASLAVFGGVLSGTCLGCAQPPVAADVPLDSTAIRLDEARRAIQPPLGATEYSVTPAFIDTVPLTSSVLVAVRITRRSVIVVTSRPPGRRASSQERGTGRTATLATIRS